MKKRRLKPKVKRALEIIFCMIISFILAVALLFGMSENHHYLLETRYASQK